MNFVTLFFFSIINDKKDMAIAHLKRCNTYIIYKQTAALHTSSLNICFYSNQSTNDHRNKMLFASDILMGNQALDNLALDILLQDGSLLLMWYCRTTKLKRYKENPINTYIFCLVSVYAICLL